MAHTAPRITPRVTIPCAHAGCRHLAATVSLQQGVLTVEIIHRHNGERHTTILTITDVDDKLRLATESASA